MDYQYEYLEQCYVETEQYQNGEQEIEEHETVQQCNTSMYSEQDFHVNQEIAEEQNVEIENSIPRYQNAENLIQSEIKEIICKKETEKTTLIILSEQRADIINQIKNLQDLRDKVAEYNDLLNINTEIEKEEFLNLQKRITYNKEIIDRLREFMETIENGFGELKQRNLKHKSNVMEQKRKVLETQNAFQIKKSQLKSDISSRKTIKQQDNPLTQENVVLKTKIIEKQEQLKKLQESNQQVEIKRENIRHLQNEADKLKTELENRRTYLKEQQDLCKKKKIDIDEIMKQMELKKEKVKKTFSDAKLNNENIDVKIQELNEEKEKRNSLLLQAKERNLQLEEEISRLAATTEECKIKLDLQKQQCKINNENEQERLRKAEMMLLEIKKENDELNYRLEQEKENYIPKMEEMRNKLLLKLEFEKKLQSDEILLENNKLLDEQIMLKKKCYEELLQKIDNLSADKPLQDLTKKKAYLISSTDYLNEKVENARKESEDLKGTINELQNDIDNYKQSNKESQEKCDKLLQDLQEYKDGKDTTETEGNIPPTSILKTPLSYKIEPISPKKVQFEGVSSYESNSSNSEAVNVNVSQQSIAGKSFDDILEEIQAEAFKKPLNIAKKRKLNLE